MADYSMKTVYVPDEYEQKIQALVDGPLKKIRGIKRAGKINFSAVVQILIDQEYERLKKKS